MEQATVVKGADSGYCLRLIQTDFMSPEKKGNFSVRDLFVFVFSIQSTPRLFSVRKVFVLCHTWRLRALKMMNTLGMIPLAMMIMKRVLMYKLMMLM